MPESSRAGKGIDFMKKYLFILVCLLALAGCGPNPEVEATINEMQTALDKAESTLIEIDILNANFYNDPNEVYLRGPGLMKKTIEALNSSADAYDNWKNNQQKMTSDDQKRQIDSLANRTIAAYEACQAIAGQ